MQEIYIHHINADNDRRIQYVVYKKHTYRYYKWKKRTFEAGEELQHL